jgi:glycosyltransferase involved in cell wall biosynthesis
MTAAPHSEARPIRILYVAYPLLTVSEESAGGAEQMLWTLEHEMARGGFLTTVAASAGSRVAGELFSTGEPCTSNDDFERRNIEHQNRVIKMIRGRSRQGRPFDLIHDKSGSFWPRAVEIDLPVLATLHLPRHFYPAHFFENVPPNVTFACVSASQARSFADLDPAIAPNGILLDRFLPSQIPVHDSARRKLLWLGRICEEKGPHLALDIAHGAKREIVLAGQVYPFSWHRQYFEHEIVARLSRMSNATLISSPSAKEKHRLLREAQAVLIPSTVDETSSLVAMEAAACGTPVVAFRRGALPEIVQDGVTGYLVDSVEEAIEALTYLNRIASSDCVTYARNMFSSAGMSERYRRLYNQILNPRDKAQCTRPAALRADEAPVVLRHPVEPA